MFEMRSARRCLPTALQVVYSSEMVAETARPTSASPGKPRDVASALAHARWPIRLVPPVPMPVEDLYRVHARAFVDEILSARRLNGFGCTSESVTRSLLFTCGAFHTAAVIALSDGISASLTSGFHHANYSSARGFCTFNGLMASAARLLAEGQVRRVAVVDCDYHYGDGTDAIIRTLGLEAQILHLSFGQRFSKREQAAEYLAAVRDLGDDLSRFRPDVVFYQAGVDVHVDDPLGGLLTTAQVRSRDHEVFRVARELGIPLTWNLAGGYQREADGSIPRVVSLHLNTFAAALAVWELLPVP